MYYLILSLQHFFIAILENKIYPKDEILRLYKLNSKIQNFDITVDDLETKIFIRNIQDKEPEIEKKIELSKAKKFSDTKTIGVKILLNKKFDFDPSNIIFDTDEYIDVMNEKIDNFSSVVSEVIFFKDNFVNFYSDLDGNSNLKQKIYSQFKILRPERFKCLPNL